MAGGDIVLFSAAGAWLGLNWLAYYTLLCCFSFLIYAIPQRLKGKLFSPMGPALSIGFTLCVFRSYYNI